MIKAVLFDLDNTLLRNPTPEFVSGYITLVNRFFSRRWNIEPGEPLRQAVQSIMNAPRLVWQSNLEVYWDHVKPLWKGTTEELRAAFDEFFHSDYEELKANTSPAPMAGEVIDRVRGEGYKIIIATNPVYPQNALLRRLAWAGLPGDMSYYEFVTTADNMHFAKPNPAYYAEILARTGLEPDEALMVGDDMRYDIEASKQIGMPAYNLNWENLGTLLDEIPGFAGIMPQPVQPESIVPQWYGNLGALFGTISDMPAHFWDQHPFGGEWSPIEIICHLRDYESGIQRPRLQKIRDENNPFLVQSPLPPQAGQMDDCTGSGLDIAHNFLAERQETIAFVNNLREEDWYRTGNHSVFGPTTLLEMAYFIAQHDRLHLRQLCQTIGGCE